MARTFLLLNSFTNIIYGEVLQNSIETKTVEYEVLLNDLEMQKRNTNQSAAINRQMLFNRHDESRAISFLSDFFACIGGDQPENARHSDRL